MIYNGNGYIFSTPPYICISKARNSNAREEKKYSLGMEGLEGILMFRLGWTTWSNF